MNKGTARTDPMSLDPRYYQRCCYSIVSGLVLFSTPWIIDILLSHHLLVKPTISTSKIVDLKGLKNFKIGTPAQLEGGPKRLLHMLLSVL